MGCLLVQRDAHDREQASAKRSVEIDFFAMVNRALTQ